MAKEYNTRDERVESPAELEQESKQPVKPIKRRLKKKKDDKEA